MADYKHGAYATLDRSIVTGSTQSGTVLAYVGTAPVNLVRGYKDKGVVNAPVKVSSLADAQAKFGMAANWADFTLCEAFAAHFQNSKGNIGPIYVINVLDPASHKKAPQHTGNVTFANGKATINSTTIVLDTLALQEKAEGVDYTMDYDFTKGQVILTSIAEEQLTGEIQVTYDEVDTSKLTETDIVGGVTEAGVYTGFGAVSLIYPRYNAVPTLLAAPGWSHKPKVYQAMVQASQDINGHWAAFALADIPADSTTGTIAKAKSWKSENGYTDERSKVFWPMGKDGSGQVSHLSTMAAVEMMRVDNEHNGVPMESPSNKSVPLVAQHFGADVANAGFDQVQANDLNAAGITTAVFWGGQMVLWGPHTAAFTHGADMDSRAIFDTSIRMMQYIANSFQRDWGTVIDQPMTRGMADTIKVREQEKAEALATMGALIGEPVVLFLEDDNSTAELAQGNFVWRTRGTPTPPFKSGEMRIAYTDEGFASYFDGGES